MRKLSENMRKALARLASGYGVAGSWTIPTSTAVALLRRDMIETRRGVFYQITPAGVLAVEASMGDLVERAHADAVMENERFRRCPLADRRGCGYTAFGTRRYDADIEADDQITYHVAMAHVPAHMMEYPRSLTRLTDKHRLAVAEWLAKELAPADRPTTHGTFAVIEEPAPVCVNSQTHAAHRIAGTADTWCPGYAELVIPNHAVDIRVGVTHCTRLESHSPHVWAYLGPDPAHFCDGEAQK